ncbi:hypothetical protein NBRC116583_24370 [Arenicella sp. 4NH20-0111]|uniref:peptide-methionine (S)-S-oxide reductase MsrA n=1 Tax=Arenicella sp. 4NH20-0111 TaxID=3127648 RepID=UPI00310204E1
MNKTILLFSVMTLVAGGLFTPMMHAQDDDIRKVDNKSESALFAGGCFWCIESDFEKLNGVISVVSGYTGGSKETADYKTVSYNDTGHFEAVRVDYNPEAISYRELVEYFWRHIDPTDPNGQFCDKGSSYKSAIFYSSDSEKEAIDLSLNELKNSKPFSEPIVTTIAAAKPFYLAEDYHQDYYKKNPIRYRFYRSGCGRDARVEELWGKK